MLAKHIQRSALLGDSAAFTHALEAARHAIASNPTAGFGWGVLAELFTEAAAEKVAMQAAPDTDLGIARIVRTFQLFFLPLTFDQAMDRACIGQKWVVFVRWPWRIVSSLRNVCTRTGSILVHLDTAARNRTRKNKANRTQLMPHFL